MDSVKQIEELGNALYCKQDKCNMSNPFEVAKVVIDLGYRKINESLISREKAQSVECKTIFSLKKQAKKELKAFAEEIKTAFYLEFDELIPSIMADKIDKIAEKYGIEKGETK